MSRVLPIVFMLVLVAAFVAGLSLFGWWTIPVIAAVYALAMRTRRAPLTAMVAALIASLLLIARHVLEPAFGRLLEQLGLIFPVPGIAVVGLALLLMMVLAYASARVATGVAGVREPV